MERFLLAAVMHFITRTVLLLGLAVGITLPLTGAGTAQVVPCDFKGVAVGDKMSREQVMQGFGITKFKLDPPRSDFMEMHEQIEKYGITGAAEREDDKIGPYCREDYCNVPWGLHVGDDNIGVKVFVALKNDMVTEIEVFFNSIFWNDIWAILVKKYGPAWDIERQNMGVMEYETKKIDQLEQIIATHKLGGVNPRTKDTCSLIATNIDIIFRHHDSLGTLHAIFVIKRDAKDF
jgi:hypothetical protein